MASAAAGGRRISEENKAFIWFFMGGIKLNFTSLSSVSTTERTPGGIKETRAT
jgi:hypothetical protein